MKNHVKMHKISILEICKCTEITKNSCVMKETIVK